MKMRLVLAGIGAAVLVFGQAPESPAFDVVSIRHHELAPGTFTFRRALTPGPPEPHTTGNRYLSNLATVQDAQRRYTRMPEKSPATTMIQMPVFASTVQLRMDRPVLDETKLTGYYEIATPEWIQARSGDSVERQAEVLSELESVDGLKLEARKDPFEVLVIDRVEQPSPN